MHLNLKPQLLNKNSDRYDHSLNRYHDKLAHHMYSLSFQSPRSLQNLQPISRAFSVHNRLQRQFSGNIRSTVGTITEIYDLLRLLFARAGSPHCPKCKTKIVKTNRSEILSLIAKKYTGKQIEIFSPIVKNTTGNFLKVIKEIQKSNSNITLPWIEYSSDLLEWKIRIIYNGEIFEQKVPIDITDFKDKFLKHPDYGEILYFNVDEDSKNDIEIIVGFYWSIIKYPDGK